VYVNDRSYVELSTPEFESVILKGVIDMQLSENRHGAITADGLGRIERDFKLAFEYLGNSGGLRFDALCKRWSALYLDAGQATLAGPEEEKTRLDQSKRPTRVVLTD
jgi:hypothetical protein